MSKILLVTSSPRGDESLSNKFASELASKIQAQSNGSITHLDLGQNPIPHLDSVTTSAIRKQAISARRKRLPPQTIPTSASLN